MISNNYYIIDASSLIDLSKHNPIDIFPTVWKTLGNLSKQHYIMAPAEVKDEISKHDDALYSWCKKNENMFKKITVKQTEIVKNILMKYPSFVKDYGNCDADPWIVALDIEQSDFSMTINGRKNIVVITEEKLDGNKIKIPYICNEYNIGYIKNVEFFRKEKMQF